MATIRSGVRPGTGVLAMERGRIDPALVLAAPVHKPGDGAGEPGSGHHEDHDHGDHEHGDHDDDHHHDHSHAEISSLVLRRQGHWDREELERWLTQLIREQPVLRLKGRLQQQGKSLPLQIQAVGPRLECWYEKGSDPTPAAPGLELVLLAHASQEASLRRVLTSLPAART
jgi:cobalamin biosynthesis protein CobW